jgi:hypothetical protein
MTWRWCKRAAGGTIKALDAPNIENKMQAVESFMVI